MTMYAVTLFLIILLAFNAGRMFSNYNNTINICIQIQKGHFGGNYDEKTILKSYLLF